jgi:hypothetical protein
MAFTAHHGRGAWGSRRLAADLCASVNSLAVIAGHSSKNPLQGAGASAGTPTEGRSDPAMRKTALAAARTNPGVAGLASARADAPARAGLTALTSRAQGRIPARRAIGGGGRPALSPRLPCPFAPCGLTQAARGRIRTPVSPEACRFRSLGLCRDRHPPARCARGCRTPLGRPPPGPISGHEPDGVSHVRIPFGTPGRRL